jgi:hypothetical protein
VHEIFALRSELGIHQVAGVEVDPLDEAVLAHLGVGEGREKVIIPCTTENLDRLSAKRNWVRPILSLLPLNDTDEGVVVGGREEDEERYDSSDLRSTLPALEYAGSFRVRDGVLCQQMAGLYQGRSRRRTSSLSLFQAQLT